MGYIKVEYKNKSYVPTIIELSDRLSAANDLDFYRFFKDEAYALELEITEIVNERCGGDIWSSWRFV